MQQYFDTLKNSEMVVKNKCGKKHTAAIELLPLLTCVYAALHGTRIVTHNHELRYGSRHTQLRVYSVMLIGG
jgi:hypothetical protein